MSDQNLQLAEQIKDAFEQQLSLSIHGEKSKPFLRHADDGTTISTLEHNGIVSYEPTELVVTVRAGTSIASLQNTLAEQQQTLAFDPPQFNQAGTVGGSVATGLSGPARPWSGAVRDYVLGARIINGKGETLNFGGQVMKNVAGYDVSRLMTGAYGTLGLLLDISFKVLPLPEHTTTMSFECDADNAIERMNTWSGQTVPLSGACWSDNRLMIRLSGTQSGVNAAMKKTGGDVDTEGNRFWTDLRDHRHAFFKDSSYWRLSLPPATPMLAISGEWFIDWGGAQRWLKTSEAELNVLQMTADANGHAEQWHDENKSFLRMPLESVVKRYHQNLKAAFDPGCVLNKGTFYAEL